MDTAGSSTFTSVVLAFFIECACPPDRRSATVGAGEVKTVEDFLDSYELTHVVCGSCDAYFQLIGWIDEGGVEHSVERVTDPRAELTGRIRRRLASSLRPRL